MKIIGAVSVDLIGLIGSPLAAGRRDAARVAAASRDAFAAGAFGTAARQAWGVFDSTRTTNNVKEGGSICLTGL